MRLDDHIEAGVGPSYSDEVIGWQYLAGSGPGPYLVSRLHQQTASLITRADIVFNVRTLLQVYVQPLVGVGRGDRYQRLLSPRAERPADRFTALGQDTLSRDPLTGAIAVWLPPGGGAMTFQSPDALRRTLNATVALRWEYRHGSFLTAVWTHAAEEQSARRITLSDGINGFRVPGGSDVLLLKLSARIGR